METLYVLVRSDLRNTSYMAVQAGHAVAQYMLDNPSCSWGNNRLIYVTVSGEGQLERWQDNLLNRGERPSMFREPDLNNQATALACYPSDNKLFKNLKLMRG